MPSRSPRRSPASWCCGPPRRRAGPAETRSLPDFRTAAPWLRGGVRRAMGSAEARFAKVGEFVTRAVAVWASSGLTEANDVAGMDGTPLNALCPRERPGAAACGCSPRCQGQGDQTRRPSHLEPVRRSDDPAEVGRLSGALTKGSQEGHTAGCAVRAARRRGVGKTQGQRTEDFVQTDTIYYVKLLDSCLTYVRNTVRMCRPNDVVVQSGSIGQAGSDTGNRVGLQGRIVEGGAGAGARLPGWTPGLEKARRGRLAGKGTEEGTWTRSNCSSCARRRACVSCA